MNIIELELTDIAGLWAELNKQHFELSSHFKEHFQNLKFDDRIGKIQENESVSIFGVEVDGKLAGYSVVTVNSGSGEIYSLFVDQNYRGLGVGDALVKHSLKWLDSKKCSNIRVYVAEGNEQALPFYERFGFKSRFHVMQLP